MNNFKTILTRKIKIILVLILSFLIRINSSAQCTCTDVTAGSNPCPPVATLYSDVNAAASATQVKTMITTLPFDVSGTSYVFCTRYTIPSGVTKIGVLNYMGVPNVTDFNRSNWQAFEVSGCGSPITGTIATSPSGGAAEFIVTPGSTYKFCVTIDISSDYSNGIVESSEFYMYDATTSTPPSGCTSTIGTVDVTGASANGLEWDVKAGATIDLTAKGFTLPPSADAPCDATYGYIIFNQAPTLPITNVTNLSSLPGYQTITTGDVCTDDNKAGSSSSLPGKNKLWFVPFTADCKVSGDPVVFDDNTDLCYKIGTSAIVVNYLPPVTCATCANAICPVVSSTGATLNIARSASTTDITAAASSNPISLDLKMDGTPVTVCVPITIPSNASLLGFKHALPKYKGCIDVKTDIDRSYTLLPATCSGTNITPKTTNGTGATITSGFNPEWNVVTTTPAAGEINPGDYIFCFTIKTSASSSCTEVPKLVLGYYTNGSCVTPIAKETLSNVKACIGATINFDGSTSTHNAASMKSYAWDFGDGSAIVTGTSATVSHTYTKSGRYIPSLVVTNSDGCSSTNAITTSVSIASVPNFKGSTTGTTCLNTQLCIDGKANWAPVTTPITITPPPVTIIPVENSVTDIPITIKGYAAGQTITSATDIVSICTNMEHSAIDDIIITLISPSGQTIILHNRGGGASVLGKPTMGGAFMEGTCTWPPSSGTGTGKGIGMDYCFNTSASQTLMQIGDANFDATNNKCYQVPAATYKALDPFTNLIGSDLNGTWILRVEDVYQNDDGTVFSWNLNLNPTLIPASNTIQPVLASQKWTAVSGTDIPSVSTTANLCITPTSLSNTDYKYEVTDDFGCIKDTTIKITIKDKPNISSIVLADVCKGIAASSMTYSSTSTGTDIATTYILDWDATANTAGFTDITTYSPFSVSPQTIAVATGATEDTYNGSLTVKNAAGCISTSPISVIIKICTTITCPEIKNPTTAFSFCSGTVPTNSLEVESTNRVKYFYSTTKLTNASGTLNSGVDLYTLATVSNTLGTSTTTGTKEKLILTSTSFPANTSSSPIDYYVYAIFNDVSTLDASCRDFEEIKVTVNICSTITCPEIKNPTAAFSFCSGAAPTNSLEVESPNQVKYFYSTTKLTNASGVLNSGVNLYTIATNLLGTSTTAGTKEQLMLTATSFPANTTSSPIDYYVYAIFNDVSTLDASCRDFKEIKVTVNVLPVLKITNPASVCLPLTIDITNSLVTLGSTGNGVLTYYTDATATTILTNPSNIGLAGIYYIKSTNVTCTDTKPVTVTFSTSSTLVVTNPAEVCQPATVDITNPKLISGNSTGAIITYCSNSAGTILLTSPNSIRNSGTYYIKSTENGCSTVVPIIVKVNLKPKANFVPTPPNVTTIDSKSTMLNTSLNAIEYGWIFSDGTVSSDVSPEHEFPNKEQSKQVVILIATSDAGCMDTINKIITVNEEVVYYVPNTFTPDDDDFNQIFKPVFTSGYDPITYHLSIFNRWGELVFESNDTEIGWAGLYGKDGVLVQEGSYTWKIEFKLKENDTRKIEVGNVNILK